MSESDTQKALLFGESVWQTVMNGESLQELNDIPQETMDSLYHCAYNLYHQHKLEEAETLFRYLCLLKARNKSYLMGLAAVHQLKKKYHRAIDIYSAAHTVAGDDFRPMFQAGYCHLIIKNHVKARYCFDLVISSSHDSELRKNAQKYLDILDKMSGNVND